MCCELFPRLIPHLSGGVPGIAKETARAESFQSERSTYAYKRMRKDLWRLPSGCRVVAAAVRGNAGARRAWHSPGSSQQVIHPPRPRTAHVTGGDDPTAPEESEVRFCHLPGESFV